MKKPTYFSILFLLIISNTLAQYQERNWEKGELNWNDFKGNALKNSELSSKINYRLIHTTNNKEINDTLYVLYNTKNFMLPRISWVKQEYKNEKTLRYNQVIFNIVELQRRKMISELHRVNKFSDAETISLVKNELAKEQIDQFITDSSQGENEDIMNKWHDEINQKLEAQPYELIPNYKIGNFGIGFNFGLESKIFAGDLKGHFTPSFGFNYGLNFAFKKVYHSLNFGLGFNKVKKEFTNERVWPKDLKTTNSFFNLSLGYPIFDSKKIRITPFLGAGFYEIKVYDIEKHPFFKNHKISNSSLMYGIETDFLLSRSLELISNYSILRVKDIKRRSKMNEYYFKVRFFYEDGLNNLGKTFNVGFYLSSLTRRIKILPMQIKSED